MPEQISRRALLRGVLLGTAAASVACGIAGCAAGSAVGAGDTVTSSGPPDGSTSASASATGSDTLIAVGPEDGPGVLLLHSWWGVRPAVHEWASLLATAGHRVLIPDMFAGRTATTVPEAEALLASVGQSQCYSVAEKAADILAAQSRPWSAVGFSIGALFAARLLGRGAAGPATVHLFYGGAAADGPVSATRRARLHVVPDDPYFTASEIADTKSALTSASVDVVTYTYPRSRHWFAERGTPGFDETAFALARSRVLADLRA